MARKQDGSLKRVVLHKGTVLQVCFVPSDVKPTLSNYDESTPREMGYGGMFISTGRDGSTLSLEADYLRNYPESEIPVYNGTKRVGAMKFVPDEE